MIPMKTNEACFDIRFAGQVVGMYIGAWSLSGLTAWVLRSKCGICSCEKVVEWDEGN